MPRKLFLTRHARKSMQARNISWTTVQYVVQNPEVSYGPDVRGRVIHQRENFSVVVSEDGYVITVLLRQTELWTDKDVRNMHHRHRNLTTSCGEGRHLRCQGRIIYTDIPCACVCHDIDSQ